MLANNEDSLSRDKLTYLKRLERGKLELIGPNGVSINLLARLSEFLSTHPATLFAEVISNTGITQQDDRSRELDKALTSVSSTCFDALLASKSRKKKTPFGNNVTWNLEIAEAMSRLSRFLVSLCSESFGERSGQEGLVNITAA